MTFKTKSLQSGKINLCLPIFDEDETIEAEIMNYFYDSLGEKIAIYSQNSPNIRRYSASFQVLDEKCGTVEVVLYLCVRVLDDSYGVTLHRREILTGWHGSKLTVKFLSES